jgi:hypothetical protein
MYAAPQPAVNFDAVGPDTRAWFVSTSTLINANVNYRTLTWDKSGVPTLSATSILTTPAYGSPLNAPAQGSTTAVNVVDDRLNMAIIRNGHLWTTRNVGVNASGGATSPNRTGVEWLELNVANGATASLVQSGRVFDPAASTPRYYYVPSLNVNAQGAMRVGFSGSKGTEFIGAYVAGRAPGDAPGFTSAPTLLKSGEASYTRLDGSGRNRWGDFSYTSIDPDDDLTIWTIQEYAHSVAPNIWGTWIASMQPNGIWDGGGDGTSWTDPANWSNDVVPGASDAVVINVAGTPTITIAGGSQTIYSLTSEENIVVTGGTLTINTNAITHGSLAISGGQVVMTSGGNKLLAVSSLGISSPGALNLTNNNLLVDYSGATTISSIESLVRNGRLFSSTAQTNPLHNTTVGVIESADYRSIYGATAPFAGATIDDTAVLVKYTYFGDTDFNGTVNFDDYSRTDAGFNAGRSGWFNGDFDLNGTINFDDYSLIDLAFNTQTTPLKSRRTR